MEKTNFKEGIIIQIEHTIIFIYGNDLDFIKSMANTIEFCQWGVDIKRWIGLLVIGVILFSTIGNISAVNLVDRDFDGFTMKVPKWTHFQKDVNETDENGFDFKSVTYMGDNLFIIYFSAPMLSENSTSWFSQGMFQEMYSDLSKCYESHECNLTILEPVKTDNQHYPMVYLTKGNEYIVIVGENTSTIKEMGILLNLIKVD